MRWTWRGTEFSVAFPETLRERLTSAFTRFRFWSLRKIAGNDHVAINLIINRNGNVFTVPSGVQMFLSNTSADAAGLDGAGVKIEAQDSPRPTQH